MKYNLIALFAISYRLLIISFLLIMPFNHDLFGEITPLSFQGFADYNFFSNFGEFKFKLENFISNYKNIIWGKFDLIDNRFPGPLFSFLIYLTNYNLDNPYFMAGLIFICELSASLVWAKYIFFRLGSISSLFFCALPIPLIFGFLHSSDAVFYFFSTILILSFNNYLNLKKRTEYILIILMTITRPTGMIFILIYLYKSYVNKNILSFLACFLFLILSTFYYLPYFIYEMNVLNNLSENNKEISETINLKKYIEKFFFLFGFVKSDSGNLFFYLLRCFCALIFIVGYFYSYFKKNLFDIILINLFVLIILFFFYPAYRYILPIVPLLCIYFFTFFSDFKKYFYKN